MIKSNTLHAITEWNAISDNGVLVVLVRKTEARITATDFYNLYAWALGGCVYREITSVTKVEYESLGELCDVPMIHISKFSKWIADYDARNGRSSK